jgi:hypothetical protein
MTQMAAWSPLPESACSTASIPKTFVPEQRCDGQHLPHDGVVGKCATDHAGEHEQDLREHQTEQTEIDDTEPERDTRQGVPSNPLTDRC